MSIELPRPLEEYVADLVRSGEYTTAEDVLAEALQEHQARRQVRMTPELERLLDEGLEDIENARLSDELRRS
ncbi:MAG: hypothetical protein N3I86_15845 [Verrucomicrobiae bacterium]|nr:hypothetical protein [Verrucomicrobiae bacterium]MDW8310704.1 hypothetical protein [Verrucomicrobiales bacterium]